MLFKMKVSENDKELVNLIDEVELDLVEVIDEWSMWKTKDMWKRVV